MLYEGLMCYGIVYELLEFGNKDIGSISLCQSLK